MLYFSLGWFLVSLVSLVSLFSPRRSEGFRCHGAAALSCIARTCLTELTKRTVQMNYSCHGSGGGGGVGCHVYASMQPQKMFSPRTDGFCGELEVWQKSMVYCPVAFPFIRRKLISCSVSWKGGVKNHRRSIEYFHILVCAGKRRSRYILYCIVFLYNTLNKHVKLFFFCCP